jgi:peptidoglycan/LPS O-acetylase OafA/YrhL
VLYDKWQLGPLRLLNLMALLLLALHFGPALSHRLPRWRALEMLGQASLPVFCAHLVLAILALAAFGVANPERSWWIDIGLLAGSFGVLWIVARVTQELDRRAVAARDRFRARRAVRLQQRGLPVRSSRLWGQPRRPGAPRSRSAKARTPPG